jgi:hypothetical protein
MLMRASAMIRRRRGRPWKRPGSVLKEALWWLRAEEKEYARSRGTPLKLALPINAWQFMMARRIDRALKLRPHRIAVKLPLRTADFTARDQMLASNAEGMRALDPGEQ